MERSPRQSHPSPPQEAEGLHPGTGVEAFPLRNSGPCPSGRWWPPQETVTLGGRTDPKSFGGWSQGHQHDSLSLPGDNEFSAQQKCTQFPHPQVCYVGGSVLSAVHIYSLLICILAATHETGSVVSFTEKDTEALRV